MDGCKGLVIIGYRSLRAPLVLISINNMPKMFVNPLLGIQKCFINQYLAQGSGK